MNWKRLSHSWIIFLYIFVFILIFYAFIHLLSLTPPSIDSQSVLDANMKSLSYTNHLFIYLEAYLLFWKGSSSNQRRLLEVSMSEHPSRAKEFFQTMRSSVSSLLDNMKGSTNEDNSGNGIGINNNNHMKRLSRYSNKRQRKQQRYHEELSNTLTSSSSSNDPLGVEASSISSSIKEWIPNIAGAFLHRHQDASEELYVTENQKPNLRKKDVLNSSISISSAPKKLVIINQQQVSSTTDESNHVLLYRSVSSAIDRIDALTSYRVPHHQLNRDNFTDSYPYPPWLPYHAPQTQDFQHPKHLYVPSLSSVKALKASIGSFMNQSTSQSSLPAGMFQLFQASTA